MRRPREIFHLALVTRHDESAVALGRSFTSMLGVLDAARRSGVTQGRRGAAGDRAVRPAVRARPARQGGRARAAWRPRRRRQGDRRPPDGLPRGLGDRVHRARRVVRLRARGSDPTAASSPPSSPPPPAGARAATVSGDGRQSRDFVYVDDVVDALVRVRAARAAGSSSTSAPACRRRCATCGSSSPPTAREPVDVAGAQRRGAALRRVARAGPHPPRLVAVDDAGRGPRRPALSRSRRVTVTVTARERGRGERPAATSGVAMIDGCTTARIPSRSTAPASPASTGSMTSAPAIGA